MRRFATCFLLLLAVVALDSAALAQVVDASVCDVLADPPAYKWVRVANEDIGEPGCKHWHVRPRFGLLGMLMNWWRVRISSGCPLARGRGRRP